ncbi:DUF6153 family protein [Streptomyces sp. Amel2xB2]|uniref:DUF6153 family protein n=1 Tax=Streptomyces sp. Amel2xB2 TaxID=1305829 RepID=UPI0021ABC52A|nr:DUF6153 family protein [Streptomyces sp. Amel2xB2]
MIGNRPAGSSARALQGRAWALPLLVMAVLGGLLAMHGLGPWPSSSPSMSMPTSASASASASHHGQMHDPMAQSPDSPDASGSRQHADDCECGGADGHTAHADATCAAGGTSGAPAMDGPAASAATGSPPATEPADRWSRTGAERAPPSLHRLQLLRI